MKMAVRPFGEQVEWSDACSITELAYGLNGLRIVISAPIGNDEFVELFFPTVNAFQVLQQCDHSDYWDHAAFRSKHLIYEIQEGGWRDPVGEHYMQALNTWREAQSEWLLVATEHCVSVISNSPPLIRSFDAD